MAAAPAAMRTSSASARTRGWRNVGVPMRRPRRRGSIWVTRWPGTSLRTPPVRNAAPYKHFSDRHEILRAVVRAGMQRREAAMRVATERYPAGDPRRIVELGRSHIDFARAEPGVFRLMFGMDGRRGRRPGQGGRARQPACRAGRRRSFRHCRRCARGPAARLCALVLRARAFLPENGCKASRQRGGAGRRRSASVRGKSGPAAGGSYPRSSTMTVMRRLPGRISLAGDPIAAAALPGFGHSGALPRRLCHPVRAARCRTIRGALATGSSPIRKR